MSYGFSLSFILIIYMIKCLFVIYDTIILEMKRFIPGHILDQQKSRAEEGHWLLKAGKSSGGNT